MASVPGKIGIVLILLSVPLVLASKWHFDLGATAGRCCAVIGLLTMIGGVILPGASMDRESSKTFSKISSESDSILANPLYADALKVVDANRQESEFEKPERRWKMSWMLTLRTASQSVLNEMRGDNNFPNR